MPRTYPPIRPSRPAVAPAPDVRTPRPTPPRHADPEVVIMRPRAPDAAPLPMQPHAPLPTQPHATQPTQPHAPLPTQPHATQPTQPHATRPTQPRAPRPTQPRAIPGLAEVALDASVSRALARRLPEALRARLGATDRSDVLRSLPKIIDAAAEHFRDTSDPSGLIETLRTVNRAPLNRVERAAVRAGFVRVAQASAGMPAIDRLPTGLQAAVVGKVSAIATSEMLPVAFLERALRVRRSVARVAVTRFEDNGALSANSLGQPMIYAGTCWVIAKDHVITNHHVLNARNVGNEGTSEASFASDAAFEQQWRNATVEFDFDAPGAAPVVRKVKGLVAYQKFNGPLDYAVLELEPPPPEAERPALLLAPSPLAVAMNDLLPPAVNIPQHPGGGPKLFAVRNNLVALADDAQLWYFTDTEGGSSGSPVLDDEWQVVGLHKKFDAPPELGCTVNQGTPIGAILGHIQGSFPAAHARLFA